MPFWLLELHPGCWSPQPDFSAAPATKGWRIFAECADDDGLTCSLLFDDPTDFTAKTTSQFFAFLSYLIQAAQQGQSWQSFFKDGRTFHPIHSFEVSRVVSKGAKRRLRVEVLQWKKAHTDVRICILESNIGQLNIFVSHAFEKATGKTPPREQRRAEANITRFFEALDAKDLKFITSQGGHDATPIFQ